jgi:hypothetical protein
MNLISGKGETSSRLPAFSLFLPGTCPNNRDRRISTAPRHCEAQVRRRFFFAAREAYDSYHSTSHNAAMADKQGLWSR